MSETPPKNPAHPDALTRNDIHDGVAVTIYRLTHEGNPSFTEGTFRSGIRFKKVDRRNVCGADLEFNGMTMWKPFDDLGIDPYVLGDIKKRVRWSNCAVTILRERQAELILNPPNFKGEVDE